MNHIVSYFLTPFRMGGKKPPTPPPTGFFPVTSRNVRISPQNFLNSSFNPFDRLIWLKFKVCTLVQVIELEPRPLLKKSGFLVKSL